MNAWLQFAHQLADAAGEAIHPYFGAHGTVETKSDQSPVTKADRAAEAAMRALITERYPEHGIYGEEFGMTLAVEKKASRASEPSAHDSGAQQTKNYTWVIDPIDGTRAFIAGGHEWGTLIALCENGVPILGVLNQPITGERWVGVVGASTQYSSLRGGEADAAIHLCYTEKDGLPRFARNDEIIKTRACASLADATISTTSRNYFTPPQARAFVKLAEQCAEVIENGDCYAYGLLALGARDVVVDAGLKPYDILALAPIINGAGGKITAWDGAAVTLTHFDTAVAVGDVALAHAVASLLAA